MSVCECVLFGTEFIQPVSHRVGSRLSKHGPPSSCMSVWESTVTNDLFSTASHLTPSTFSFFFPFLLSSLLLLPPSPPATSFSLTGSDCSLKSKRLFFPSILSILAIPTVFLSSIRTANLTLLQQGRVLPCAILNKQRRKGRGQGQQNNGHSPS